MKRHHLIILLVLSITLLFSCNSRTPKNKTVQTVESGSKITVIDFYSTHRCKTCLKIENNTKKLLHTSFQKEMDSGVLSFQTVNVDEKANYDMAERFEAAGTALFINVVNNGQEKHIDITDFAFMKAFNDDEFASELKIKIEEQLKTL